MDSGQDGLIAADPLDFLIICWNSGDLGPCFPWGSIISGSGSICIISAFWTLNCLPSDIDCLPSDFDIFHFFTVLCSHALYQHSAFCDDDHVSGCVLYDCVTA